MIGGKKRESIFAIDDIDTFSGSLLITPRNHIEFRKKEGKQEMIFFVCRMKQNAITQTTIFLKCHCYAVTVNKNCYL